MKLHILHNQMEDVEGLDNAYPYTCHFVDFRNTQIPWHWHEALEINLVKEGSICVSTTEKSLTFQKNEAFFINSNVLTTMTANGDCVMESHLFHGVFLSGHFKSIFETKYLTPITQNRHIDLVCIRGESAPQQQILVKLSQLGKLQARKDQEFQTRNLLSEIWLSLLEEINRTDVQTGNPRNQDRLLNMLAYIHDNYTQKITLEQIADAASVSTRECLRCFQSSIQQTPLDYLITYRIRTAQKMLTDTQLPVTEVALRTGFNSSAYFAKVFRTCCGMTPLAYRKDKQRQ